MNEFERIAGGVCISDRPEQDYVLGTTDEELDRLGIQHRVWKPTVLECWRRAGITAGSRVLDVGAGPGYATLDLAEMVGPTGEVVALERSNRFVQFGKAACHSRGLGHVRWAELDLVTDQWPVDSMDAAWCRWVASFVADPEVLVAKLARAIKPGGVAVFHEYIDYSTWRLAPPCPMLEEFVARVMTSWRSNGGEPDIMLTLPSMLARHSFRIRSATPRIFCARPGDAVWQWPASFIKVNSRRLLETNCVDEEWVAALDREFAFAQSNPASLMLTPMLLEMVCERRSVA